MSVAGCMEHALDKSCHLQLLVSPDQCQAPCLRVPPEWPVPAVTHETVCKLPRGCFVDAARGFWLQIQRHHTRNLQFDHRLHVRNPLRRKNLWQAKQLPRCQLGRIKRYSKPTNALTAFRSRKSFVISGGP